MKQVLIQIRPFDAVTNLRRDVYVADGPNGEAFGASGVAWSPAILIRPQTSFEFFSLDMDGRIQAGRAQFTVLVDALTDVPRARDLYWQGAEVSIWFDWAREAAGGVPDFMGLITQAPLDRNSGRLSVTAEVPITDIDKPLLTKSFTGNGGIGGDIGKRGVLLPAGFGSVNNIEPIWFDLVRNIGTIDGYGNTLSIDWLGEGLSSFGPRVNNYPTYAALAAAIDGGTIRPGQWGTCVAEGLVGLGAPPAGVITVHAVFGANRAGAMIRRIAETHLGIAADRINTADLAALDLAVNRPTHYWTAEQRNAKDLIEAIARSCNATPLISAQRLLTVTRAVSSAPVAVLDRSGSTGPRVIRWRPGQPDAPFSKIKARAARPARVLRNDEVNYVDTLIERGSYDPAEIYRAGNIVELPDGSRWIYSAAVPSSGNAPFEGSAFWGNHVTATEPDWASLTDNTGTRPADNATRNDDGGNMLTSPLRLDQAILINGAAFAGDAAAPSIQLFTPNALGIWCPKVECRPSETLFLAYNLRSDGAGAETCNASYSFYNAAGEPLGAINLSDRTQTTLNAVAGIDATIRCSFETPSTAFFIQPYIERPVATGQSFFARLPYLGRAELGSTRGAVLGVNIVDPVTGTVPTRDEMVPAEVIEARGIEIGATRGAILDANPDFGNIRYLGGGLVFPEDVITAEGEAASYAGRAVTEQKIFTANQNRVFNSQFKYRLAGWSGGAFVWYNDWLGTFVSAPLGTGGVQVLSAEQPINCGQSIPVTLSATFRGDASVNQFLFVDVAWHNGGNNALVGYSSTATNGVFWSNIATTGDRKSQTFNSPNATDGSGFVKAYIRIVTNSDVAVSVGELLVTKIQLETGSIATLYNEAADDGAILSQATGQIRDSRNLNISNSFGLPGLSLPCPLADTVIGGQLYLTIGAGSYSFDGGVTVNYPSATLGPGPFGLFYHVWANVPVPGQPPVSYDASPDVMNTLGTGKHRLGGVQARADAGSPPQTGYPGGAPIDNGGGYFIP